jgi:hypothetical protein
LFEHTDRTSVCDAIEALWMTLRSRLELPHYAIAYIGRRPWVSLATKQRGKI